jgi:hypothetical protein
MLSLRRLRSPKPVPAAASSSSIPMLPPCGCAVRAVRRPYPPHGVSLAALYACGRAPAVHGSPCHATHAGCARAGPARCACRWWRAASMSRGRKETLSSRVPTSTRLPPLGRRPSAWPLRNCCCYILYLGAASSDSPPHCRTHAGRAVRAVRYSPLAAPLRAPPAVGP